MSDLQIKKIDSRYYYNGDDLGFTRVGEKNTFKFWSPLADELILCIYDKEKTEYPMVQDGKGVWKYEIEGDLEGKFYTFICTINKIKTEGVDPYAKAVSVNGEKGAIIDLIDTNPKGWKEYENKAIPVSGDSIIYEVSIRDLSVCENSGIKNKGKFLSLTEDNTRGKDGVSTGLSHIKELGVTHVQLLPIFDFESIDENAPLDGSVYNWGYEPQNYNVPEGSYATNPYDPYSRIRELKEGILTLHKNGIGVIMDVVYNHMKTVEKSGFHKLMPGYYFRYDDFGNLSDETGCGNVIATENLMARKFIVDSVKYWAKEYKLDGFRFDLMGLMDVETMKEIRRELDKINPNIITIGEGWNMGSLLKEGDKAIQKNAYKLRNIAFFNDIVRDGIRGNAFIENDLGFVNGGKNKELLIKKGIVGGVKYSNEIQSFGEMEPNQCVNYVECHDNHTLYDKLALTELDKEKVKERARLGMGIVLLSQGIPFIQCGQDFYRSKIGVENSYNFPDMINQINWDLKGENLESFEYIKGLIKLRKEYPEFRMKTTEEIRNKLTFIYGPENSVSYKIKCSSCDGELLVVHNSNEHRVEILLNSSYAIDVLVDKSVAGTKSIKNFVDDKIKVDGKSTLVALIK